MKLIDMLQQSIKLGGRRVYSSLRSHRPFPKPLSDLLNPENGDEPAPRSFKAIVADMESRKLQEDELLKGDRTFTRAFENFIGPKKRCSYLDYTAGFRVGDLVVSEKNGISVIIAAPQSLEDDNVAICTISGALKYVRKRDLSLKFENFAPPEMLDDCIRELSVDGLPMKILQNDVRQAICRPLREFYKHAHAMAPLVRDALDALFRNLAHDEKTISIPFYELARFVSYVTNVKHNEPELEADPKFYPELLKIGFPLPYPTTKRLEGVQSKILFMTHQLVEKVFCNRALLDPVTHTVTILSQRSVQMADSALKSIRQDKVVNKINEMLQSGESVESLSNNKNDAADQAMDVLNYLKRYALNDFNDLDSVSHSAAISLLRHLEPFKGTYINPESALSVQSQLHNLNEHHGPKIESEKFAAVQNEFNSHLYNNLSSSIDNFPDSMYSFRQEDITGRTIYCIDSADAEEIDDGISIIKKHDEKWIVGVHVADPASSLMTGTSHLNEILNRAYRISSTAYLPRESVAMLPKEFKEAFGLDNGKVKSPRRCLTFEFHYNPKFGKVDEKSIEIRPQLVENLVSLTYDQVDQILAEAPNMSKQHEDLHSIHTIARNFGDMRKRNGAVDIDFESYSARVQADSDDIELIQNSSASMTPASKVVSEMMIIANYLTAGYTRTNSIPNIYRAQLLNFTDDDSKGINVLQRMRAATLIPTAYAHESMGLKYYTHVTSPLRRFQDLISHWQIEAHLSNGKYAMLDRSQIFTIATWLHSTQLTINQARKQSTIYWILRKIEQLAEAGSSLVFECVLMRPNTNRMAYCTNWGLDVFVSNLPSDARVGDKFQCSLVSVNSNLYKLEVNIDN